MKIKSWGRIGPTFTRSVVLCIIIFYMDYYYYLIWAEDAILLSRIVNEWASEFGSLAVRNSIPFVGSHFDGPKIRLVCSLARLHARPRRSQTLRFKVSLFKAQLPSQK